MNIIKRFYVLEGLDGAGTTTQIKLLEKRFRTDGIAAFITAEPTPGPIGRLIRSILRGDIRVTPQSLAHLFVADRCDHIGADKTGILARIDAGQVVVSDRYLFSSLAYQSIDCGFRYVASLNAEFPLPEAIFYLEVSTQTAMKRSEDRGSLEIFENLSFQTAVSDSYERALTFAENSGVRINRIDGSASPEQIHEDIWDMIRNRLNDESPSADT